MRISSLAPPETEKDTPAPPRVIRTCCAFGANIGITGIPFFKLTDVISIDDLGTHRYMGSKEEGNGIIYTSSGGFIDLGHVRDHADWTAFIYNRILENAHSTEPVMLELRNEGGAKTLIIPSLKGNEEVDVFELAGRIAYDISLWHEIATWFGASYVPFVAERYSSFSPEDIYSNLLGVKLGIEALKSELDYDSAMTMLLSEALQTLGVVEGLSETVLAMREVDALWWSSERRIPSRRVLVEHFIDPGEGEALTPWLVPERSKDVEPHKLDKPGKGYDHLYELTIKLNYKFPRRDLCPDDDKHLVNHGDFDHILDYIRAEEEEFQARTFAKQAKRNRSEKAG